MFYRYYSFSINGFQNDTFFIGLIVKNIERLRSNSFRIVAELDAKMKMCTLCFILFVSVRPATARCEYRIPSQIKSNWIRWLHAYERKRDEKNINDYDDIVIVVPRIAVRQNRLG